MIQVKSIVQYQFDVGARMGTRTLLGVVEKAGKKTYTVRWESGIRNRIERDNTQVKLTTDPEFLQEASKTFPEAFRGTAGLIETRTNRLTKTEISLYAAAEADPETPWATVCEAHGSLVVHTSKSLARSHMAVPEWCSKCGKIMRGENPDSEDDDT